MLRTPAWPGVIITKAFKLSKTNKAAMSPPIMGCQFSDDLDFMGIASDESEIVELIG
jgi:hypothetical protein